MSYEPPLTITISTPDEIPKGFGPNSTGGRGGNLRVRCTNAEYDMLKEEARLVGVSQAMFTRWCAVQVATKLKQHREAGMTSISIGHDDEGDSK